jgi:hypothetical protein
MGIATAVKDRLGHTVEMFMAIPNPAITSGFLTQGFYCERVLSASGET